MATNGQLLDEILAELKRQTALLQQIADNTAS
jgi:hypothetical protein